LSHGHDFPDATNGIPCCEGYAAYDHSRCTCWEPVYDQEQQPYVEDSKPVARKSPCHDCAYRKGSPERSGEKGYRGDEDELNHIAATGQEFWCHQGMRRPIAYRHPSGMQVPSHPAAYAPEIIVIEGKPTPLKADGTPACICGGWSGKRKALLAEVDKV